MEELDYFSELKRLYSDVVSLQYLLRRLKSEGDYWLDESRITIEEAVRAGIVRVFGKFTDLMRERSLCEIKAQAETEMKIYEKLQNLYLREGLVFEEVEGWPSELGCVFRQRPEVCAVFGEPL